MTSDTPKALQLGDVIKDMGTEPLICLLLGRQCFGYFFRAVSSVTHTVCTHVGN